MILVIDKTHLGFVAAALQMPINPVIIINDFFPAHWFVAFLLFPIRPETSVICDPGERANFSKLKSQGVEKIEWD